MGRLVTELSEQGTKERTLVYAGGSVLASQKVVSGVESVDWEHWDASRASYKSTKADGSPGDNPPMETDALGANAGIVKPLTWNVTNKKGLPVPYAGIADMLTHPGGGCIADRVPTPCHWLTGDNSLECPNGDCSPEEIYNPVTQRKELTPVSQNPNNGQIGFWPSGANGTGVIIAGSGVPTYVTVSTDGTSMYVWKEICFGGSCAYGPEPTAYSGTSFYKALGFTPAGSSLPQSTGDPCSGLVRFSLRDESRDGAPTKYPFINSSVAAEFDAALQEINTRVDGGIGFNEVFRTSDHQTDLYNAGQKTKAEWEARPWYNKIGRTPPLPALPPGTSAHEAGFAFDIPRKYLTPTVLVIFETHGFRRDVPNDPIHVQWTGWNRLLPEQQKQFVSTAQSAYSRCH